MTDTILGLPLHPLVVHGVVVLLPLMAVVTAAVAMRRPWRERYAWLVAVLDALVLGMTVVAKQSGEALQQRLGVDVSAHEAWGTWLPLVAAALLAVAVLVALWRRNPQLGSLSAALAVVVALLTLFWTVRTGHTGAIAVWGGIG